MSDDEKKVVAAFPYVFHFDKDGKVERVEAYCAPPFGTEGEYKFAEHPITSLIKHYWGIENE